MPNYLLNDTCDVKIRPFGLGCWDITWMVHKMVGIFAANFNPYHKIEMLLDFLTTTPEEWGIKIRAFDFLPDGLEMKLRNFDFLLAFTGNEFNPFRIGLTTVMEMGDPFWKSGGSIAMGSPPDDVFMEIFGAELYGVYWNHLVEPARVVIAELFYRIEAGPLGLLPDWIRNHCFWDWLGIRLEMPDPHMFLELFFGFRPGCIDVQADLKWKVLRVYLVLFGWIAWIFLFIIRFITLCIYLIVWLIFSILGFLINLILQIRLWIVLNIILPIIELLWPVIEFFLMIHGWIMFIILIPVNFILAIHLIIWNFLWSIYFMILCFFLWLHDYLWSLYWFVYNFLYELIWPIIQWIIEILWFIPMFLLACWHWLMALIIIPLDQICIDIFLWIEANILDPILEAVPAPEWQPALGYELALSQPILWYHQLATYDS